MEDAGCLPKEATIGVHQRGAEGGINIYAAVPHLGVRTKKTDL